MKAVLLDLLSGHGLVLPLATFVLTATVVFLIAARLARHAEAIADATGLGHLWIGAIVLAAATSLPELTTDVSAAALGTPDIGIGDLFGSTLSNMMILAALDLAFARRRILQQVAMDHALVGTVAILMTGVAALSIASGGFGQLGPVGVDALMILGLYLFGMRAVYRATQSAAPTQAQLREPVESSGRLLRRGLSGMGLAALGLLATAPLLVIAAEAISLEAGVSQTLVGTTLVGFTTSFPEIAASVAAVRMGALDLAVGNLFGSNAFNLCIVVAMDLAYPGGPILAAVSRSHLASALAAILCIGLGMLAILTRTQYRPSAVRVESLLILGTCVIAVTLLARG